MLWEIECDKQIKYKYEGREGTSEGNKMRMRTVLHVPLIVVLDRIILYIINFCKFNC